MIRVLLSEPNIDIQCQDTRGVSPLWTACQNGHHQVVELLTHPDRGVDINLSNVDGCTPLWVAASRGHAKCIQHLIDRSAELDQPDMLKGATPLFVACQNGNREAVKVLLAANADIHKARSEDGSAPLMMAAHNGHLEIVRILLQNGANAMQLNHTDLSAFGCAAMRGHLEIVKMLYQHITQDRSLENMNAVECYVNRGDSQHGWTPLHLASMQDNEDVIHYLIHTVKVDVTMRDLDGKIWAEHRAATLEYDDHENDENEQYDDNESDTWL